MQEETGFAEQRTGVTSSIGALDGFSLRCESGDRRQSSNKEAASPLSKRSSLKQVTDVVAGYVPQQDEPWFRMKLALDSPDEQKFSRNTEIPLNINSSFSKRPIIKDTVIILYLVISYILESSSNFALSQTLQV